MRSAPAPLSFVVSLPACVCVFFCSSHTLSLLSPQPASQTPCPFSENTTCVTKAANLLSTAVSPVWGEKHFPSPSQSLLWSHSNPLSHHSTKINHYAQIGLLLCSAARRCRGAAQNQLVTKLLVLSYYLMVKIKNKKSLKHFL